MSPWPSPSPSSPVENPFGGGSVYPLGGNQSPGGSNVYGRTHQNEKWPMNGDSLLSAPLHRQDLGWSTPNSTMSSSHSMPRRRDPSSDAWPTIQSQSNNRWQGSPASPETSPASQVSPVSGLYQDRNRVRSAHPYDDGQMMHRRENESAAAAAQNNFPLRYNTHPNGTREGALQRLHWHSRDLPDSTRDHRRLSSAQATNQSFPHSPNLAFNAQGYHSNATTYTSSWTTNDSTMMPPTLHSISSTQSGLSYDNAYSSNVNSAPISSPEEFSNVEEYRES